MKTLTRRDIAAHLEKEVGSFGDAYRFVDVFFDEMGAQIAASEQVKIHGFGVFRLLQKKARAGRNPKTGAPAVISPRRAVSFVASAGFKQIVAARDNG